MVSAPAAGAQPRDEMRGGAPALFALALLLVLAGCVSAPPQKAPPSTPWSQRRAELQSLDPFGLSGRIAVAAGSEGFSAHLTWEQSGARTTVQLNGPLGIGGIHVVADGSSLHVESSQGKHLESEEARAELRDKLGFDPPLTSLRYWVLGVPDPAMPSMETVSADQRLEELEQDGWHIIYSDYMSAGGRWLPQRLALSRSDVRVRMVVDRWQP
jgi:outer membrane lipoprotein LolB